MKTGALMAVVFLICLQAKAQPVLIPVEIYRPPDSCLKYLWYDILDFQNPDSVKS